MKRLLSTVIAGVMAAIVFGQEKEFNVEIHGFVGVNAFYDSQQSVIVRNGNIFLFPKRNSLDAEGNNINTNGTLGLDAAISRFNIGVTGPEMFGAKSFAFIEGDFMGKSGAIDLNFRIRHAYVRLNWDKTSLLAGQYWHPLFIPENYPETVNVGVGVVHHPLNRQPMVRLGYQLNENLEVAGYLMSQNDFADKGMAGAAEQSLRPEADIQFKYKTNNGFFAAFTAGYKSLKPQLVDPINGVVTDELAQSNYIAGSLRKNFNKFTFKTEAIYGGGMTNVVMLGGYAEKNNGSEQRQYTPLQNLSLWTDIQSNSNKIQPGIFLGYSENMGANTKANIMLDADEKPMYTLGQDIGYMYTIGPRVKFFAAPKVWFGVEWWYTVAAYGNGYDDYAKPIDLEEVSNHRIMASIRYSF